VKTKLLIAVASLITIWVSVGSIEYEPVMCFGILFNVIVSVAALLVLMGIPLWAPEGYEDETGFHVGALARVAVR
jgi:hypothetical protein